MFTYKNVKNIRPNNYTLKNCTFKETKKNFELLYCGNQSIE